MQTSISLLNYRDIKTIVAVGLEIAHFLNIVETRMPGEAKKQPAYPISPGVGLHSPGKLNILVDGAGDYHGDNGIVPGADEHESETQAHPEEGQSPGYVEREGEGDRCS